jgi:dCMP deaminase
MHNERSAKWHIRFIKLAREIALWSKDPSSKIGAVIVSKHGDIISQGYNGFPRGVADTEERLTNREEKLKRVVHGEANAIYNAARRGAATDGASIYVCLLPICENCAKAIIQAGITNVYIESTANIHDPAHRWYPSWRIAMELFNEACVVVIAVDMETGQMNACS